MPLLQRQMPLILFKGSVDGIGLVAKRGVESLHWITVLLEGGVEPGLGRGAAEGSGVDAVLLLVGSVEVGVLIRGCIKYPST